MKLGFTPINAQILDLEQAFRLAFDLELDFVELTYDLQEIDARGQPVQAVRELSRTTGVAVSVHLAFVDLNMASLMPGVRENSVARTNRGLEYASEVNAIVGVLHTGLIPLRHPIILPRARAALTQSLSEITPLVPIALENLALDGYDLLRGPAELEAVTLEAGSGFGNCIDLGHAVVEGCSSEVQDGTGSGGLHNGLMRLESYKSELSNVIHLHLQDNDGSGDQHHALGTGGINWVAQRDWLGSFPGTASLEINGGEAEVRQSVRFLRELLA
jgi:sugar phosphate isomerase/epimerase